MNEETPTKVDKKIRMEPVHVEPIPKDATFFEWIEGLFYKTPEPAHFPEKIELRVGKGKDLEIYGSLITQIPFAPKSATEESIKKGTGRAKPTREELVHLSNDLLFRMQKDCDESRRARAYVVWVWHFNRGDEPYERWVKRCSPQGKHLKEEPNGDDEPMSTQERFSTAILGHGERMFSLYGGGFEGLLDRMDRILERQDSRIEKQDARIEKQAEMLERALSLQADRDNDRAWNLVKIQGAQKALDLGLGLAPPLLNALTGKSVVPTSETPETIALKNFFKKKEDGGLLTVEQSDALFGKYEEAAPHKCLVPGVLTFEQAKLLYDVSQCALPADELDKLMPGGQHALTVEQVGALQTKCSLTMEQLLPLRLVFDARAKRHQVTHPSAGSGQAG